MKQQRIVDVIAYLLETVVLQQQNEMIAEPALVKQQLEDVGFAKETIIHAFDWLKELIQQQSWYADCPVSACKTMRIFGSDEVYKIDSEARGFILSLESVGVLDTKMREIVISQLMQLNQQSIDLVDAKWVVLLVLMSKSNKNIHEMRSYLLTTMAKKA